MPLPAVIQLMAPGLDLLHRAQTVAVHDGAREQVGHRGQADVRVRAHIVL